MYILFYFFSIFMVEKGDFLKVAKILLPKKRFLVTLRSIFLTYEFFPGQGWLFPVSTFQEEYLNEKISSLTGLKKIIHFSAKVLILAIFDYLGWLSKLISSTYRQNFKNPWSVSLERLLGTLCHDLSFLSSKECGGASRFASRHFPKSVILANCYFVRRPFLACYACSIVIFLSY